MKQLSTPLFIPMLLAALPGIASAADPVIYAHEAQVVTNKSDIFLYRLPVKGSDGIVRKFDIKIPLKVIDPSTAAPAALYAPALAAGFTRAASPGHAPGTAVVGQYKTPAGNATCTLSAQVRNGHQGYTLSCTDDYDNFYVEAYAGPITGHPFKADLTTDGVDTQVGGTDDFWGYASVPQYTVEDLECADANEDLPWTMALADNQVTVSSRGGLKPCVLAVVKVIE